MANDTDRENERKKALAAKKKREQDERAAAAEVQKSQLLKSHLRRQKEWKHVGPELTHRDQTRREKRAKLVADVAAIGLANRKKAQKGQTKTAQKGE